MEYFKRQNRREELKKIFDDTFEMMRDNDVLKESIAMSKHLARFYDYADYKDLPDGEGSNTVISVTSERSLEAAKRLLEDGEGRVAVLNFANCSTPGGGVFGGSGAQEESLCRCSTLYPLIEQERFRHLYYEPNRVRWDFRATDAIIYTPDVIVFKSDTDYPELLPESEWYNVDVITCAAPNLRYGFEIFDDRLDKVVVLDSEEQYRIHLSRAKHIYNVALANGARRLILGAFGCGAFRNNPESVARAFKDALDEYKGQFSEIVFAIYHTPEEIDNYETFRRVFMSDEKQNKTKKKLTGYITELDEGEIFVFGSNGMGAHLGGAAATAVAKFGAIYGQAEGLQGQSYAINTMDGFEVMAEQVARFIEFAREHPELKFLVTEIGCGIAGYSPEEVAPLFKDAPENVVLPEAFNKFYSVEE